MLNCAKLIENCNASMRCCDGSYCYEDTVCIQNGIVITLLTAVMVSVTVIGIIVIGNMKNYDRS